MKKSFNPIIIAIAIPVFAIIFAIASVLYKKSASSNSAMFLVDAYIDAPTSFFGNKYLLKAQVDSQLAYKEGTGRLLCVKMQNGSRVAIIVPIEIGKNIQAGQKYGFDVEVMQDGSLITRGLEKF